jgi:putative flippase GtrA
MSSVPTTRWLRSRRRFACVAIRAAKFLAVGLVNSAVAFATIAISIEVLGLSDFAANLLGYAVGLVTGFALNRRWTFASARRSPAALLQATLLQYVVAFAFSYALNICVVLGARAYGLGRLSAQALGIPVYTVSFFLLCHYVVFRAGVVRIKRESLPG